MRAPRPAAGWRFLSSVRASRLAFGAAAIVLTIVSSAAAWVKVNPSPEIVVGKVELDEPIAIAQVIDDAPPHREPPPPKPPTVRGGVPRFSQPSEKGLWPPDGKPPGPALVFAGTADESRGLQFVLILGSDSRGGNPDRSRSDSIHILALDPKTKRGTILGIPRDSWVPIPGHGTRKINEALYLGGPELAVRTLRDLTGLPITYYILTAFEGMRAIVNELGGIDVHVPYDMNDWPSGAYFQAGWHHMNGDKALAFSRNRHIPAGDFARSENQGRLMLDVLKKIRAETRTRQQVESWLQILGRHARVDMSFGELVELGVLARVTAASSVRNVVAPGRTGQAGRASVVFLTEQANELFRDVAADGYADGSYPAYGPVQSNDQGAEEPAPGPSPSLPLP